MTLVPPQEKEEGKKSHDDTIPLQRFPGLYIKTSTPKGRGVFASQPVPAGATIDICSVLILDPRENRAHVAQTSMYHYTYNWPATDGSTTTTTQAVVFGLGSMFNHSKDAQNVGWKRDVARQVIVYRALRDIRPGEELCISYGDRLTFEDADGLPADGASEDEEEHLGRIQLES